MERYTVRILYRDRENPGKFMGVVETDGTAVGRGFVGKEGLWKILDSMDRGKSRGEDPSPGTGRSSEFVSEILKIMSEEC